MKMIELTLAHGGKLLLNIHAIVAIQPSTTTEGNRKIKGTTVHTMQGSFVVLESYNKIWSWL